MSRAAKGLGTAVKIVLIVLIVLLLFYNVIMLFGKFVLKQDKPTFFGIAFSVVTSGSMEPTIKVHDVIVTKSQSSYEVGDVITFFDSARNEYVTHRIVLKTQEAYTTKGDANNGQDAFSVPQSAVVGKVVGNLGGVGKVVQFLQSPLGFFCVIAVGAVAYFAVDLISKAKRGRNET